MSRIKPLNPHVVNKIAAGEVIERPASVVKELLENSVDALATRIEVDIVEGGTELIRVVDDGEGIHPDDLPLAVCCHATSKIDSADDLFRVQTLGFRGEALASIAEVSRFRIRSRPADCPSGMELDVTLGVRGPPKPCGCPAGTLIELSQLFANTPVRRKFLKAIGTEFGHISEQFTRIALAHPRLHMVLRHNRKMVYELPATDRLLDRITLFFGGELAANLIPVESELDGTRIWGYVAHPSQSKSTRKGQYLFLNGRWIQDRSLQHALTEAYRGLLMVGRNPVTFLFLEMPPDLVDVNVHPTKAEVRFRESQKLYRQLLAMLRTRFLSMDLDSPLRVSGTGEELRPGELRPAALRPIDLEQQRQVQQELVGWAKEQALRWGSPLGTPDGGFFDSEPVEDAGTILRVDPGMPFPASVWPGPAEASPAERPEGELASRQPDEGAAFAAGPFAAPGAPAVPGIPSAPGMTVRRDGGSGGVRAMQVHDAYLVVETAEGLTVVDQHALHERILYEQLRNRVLAGKVESQRLLIPEAVEMSAAEGALLHDHAELLAQLGLDVEGFGGQTVLVSSYPVMLSRADPVQIVRDVMEQLAAGGQKLSRRDLLDSLLHMMSCKAAIKAGQRLTPEEIESLLVQRHLVNDAHHCPHGRPTALLLSRAELDRQFGRWDKTMICVSIGRTRHKMMIAEHKALAERGAELVELRLDWLSHAPDMNRLLRDRPTPVIVTCRRQSDKGRWKGTDDQRRMLLRSAIVAGAEYVDLEEDVAQAIPRYGCTKRIISYHNFDETPADLAAIHARLCGLDPDIVKIVTMANTPADNVRMLQLVAGSKVPTVGFCMGELGVISRILTGRYGAPFVYATFSRERTMAPGQLTFEEMRRVYHYDTIDAQTGVYGVLGDPIAHSLSPLLHNAAFQAAGLNKVYVPIRVPRDALPSTLEQFAWLNVQGYSVTLPHKEAVLEQIKHHDGPVEAIGAANTLYRDEAGQWSATNTDYDAALESLLLGLQSADPLPLESREFPPLSLGEPLPLQSGDPATLPSGDPLPLPSGDTAAGGGGVPTLAGKKVLMLGAGGVARAIGLALVRADAVLMVTNRTKQRASDLAAHLGCQQILWENRGAAFADIVVNCTPVGMHPAVDETPFAANWLREGTMVFDTIYTPEQTLLIKQARERGCRTVTGVEMFVRQAARQFQLFTGLPAPVDVMRETMRKAISFVSFGD